MEMVERVDEGAVGRGYFSVLGGYNGGFLFMFMQKLGFFWKNEEVGKKRIRCFVWRLIGRRPPEF